MQRSFLTDRGEHLSFRVDRHDRIGAGGQGQVFRADLAGSPVAVKLIRQPDERRLQALMALEERCGSSATLPCRLVYADNSGNRGDLVGYAMRWLDPATSLPLLRLFNFEEIAKLSRFSWRDAVLAALRLAEAVAALHRCGVVIGDLNCENVMFCRQDALQHPGVSTWRAVLLDSDSFQLQSADGQRFCCPVSRATTTAPELLGAELATTWRSVASDNFALAVLIHQILLHDHPYDNAIYEPQSDLSLQERIARGLYPHRAIPVAGLKASPYRPAPRQISEAIDRAFRRSFHPSREHLCCGVRPSASSWVVLLRELHGQIIPCARNPHHHHPRGVECLWCAVDQAAGHPISRFPTGLQSSGRPDPGPPTVPAAPALPRKWRTQLQPVESHLRRGLLLRQRHGEQVDRLLSLAQRIDCLHASYGDATRLLDLDALPQNLTPPRRSFRQRLLRRPAPPDPQAEVEALKAATEVIVSGVRSSVIRLQEQQRQLLDDLAAFDLAELEQSLPAASTHHEPGALISALLYQQIATQREQRLQRQLQAIPLRILADGFVAEGRLLILEAHGIHNGLQLQSELERITDLQGIGSVTQNQLRQRLSVVVKELRQRSGNTATVATLQVLLEASGLANLPEIEPLEQKLAELQHQLTTLEQTFNDLEAAVVAQVEQQEQQLRSLQQRFG